MNSIERARLKADMKRSGRTLPLTLAILKAAAEQRASIGELEDAYSAATTIIRDTVSLKSVGEIVGETEAAFESLGEYLRSFLD